MKPMLTFIFFLSILALACGATLPREISTPVNTATPYQQIPVKVVISDPTEAAPVWITTGALNVRSQANADSEILGTLAPFTEIQIYVIDQFGDDCYLGEWYQIDYKPEGSETVKAYVCSLWVVRK